MKLPIGTKCEYPCPDCGSDMVLRPSTYGLFYGCVRFPLCKSTHGAHAETGQPLGIPANKKTKEFRIRAHDVFDKIWKGPTRTMTRKKSYVWMQQALGMTEEEAHIGLFDIDKCRRLIRAVEAHLGQLGTPEKWRFDALKAFDKLWDGKPRLMKRKAAKTLLRQRFKEDNIGKFNIGMCKALITQVEQMTTGEKNGKA